jgi:hypothetical protein
MGNVFDLAYLWLHRILVVLVGLLFGFFGYRLIRLGIYEKADELRASWNGAGLVLRQAGPGIFFALLGTIIISLDVFEPSTIYTASVDLAAASVTPVHAEKDAAAKASREHELPEITPILAKLRAGQKLSNSEIENVDALYRNVSAFRLGHITEAEARTLIELPECAQVAAHSSIEVCRLRNLPNNDP